MARIEVDEDGAPGVQRDRQPEREVAPEVPGRSPVDPLGQERALDAERLEGGQLSRSSRSVASSRVLRLVVIRHRITGLPGQHGGLYPGNISYSTGVYHCSSIRFSLTERSFASGHQQNKRLARISS